MSVPPLVVDLVERFRRNEDAYRSGQYNETQVRREFIDPFFECLGWDVNNQQGYAEGYEYTQHQQQTTATTDHERTLLERQITATDRQIDQLVYTLYGLTDKEIALVEGAT